jgi:hypothetical protein
MSVLARAAHQHQRDTEHIQTFKHQLNASRTNFVKARTKTPTVAKEVGCLMQEINNYSQMQSPDDRVYFDIKSTLIATSGFIECGV